MKLKLIIISLFFLQSCSKKDFNIKKENLLKLLSKEVLINSKAIILIPLNGCGACVKGIIDFSLTNLDNKKIHFIIVEMNKKDIHAVYQGVNNYKSKITIDHKLIFEGLKMVSTAPIVYFLNTEKTIIEELKVDEENTAQIINRLTKLYLVNSFFFFKFVVKL